MRHIVSWFISLSILLFSIASNCDAKDLNYSIDSLWITYNTAENTSLKIQVLQSIAEKYLLLGNYTKRDSLIGLEILLSSKEKQDSFEINVYKIYFSYFEYFKKDTAAKYLNRFLILAELSKNSDDVNEANLAKAKYLLKINELENAIKCTQQLIKNVIGKNVKQTVEGYLILGNCYEKSNKKIEAFEEFTNAISIAQKSEDWKLLYNCYGSISDFYRIIQSFDMALFYSNKQAQEVFGQKSIDSVLLMQNYCDLALILFDKGIRDKGEKTCKSVIDFAKTNHYEQLKSKAFKYYRTYLIKNGLFNDLYNLFEVQYPEEYKQIQKNDTTLYYRITAFIQEGKGNFDSAKIYYILAESRLLKENTEKIFLSNFIKRYGEFLLRMNDLENAKDKFLFSFHIAQSAHYLPFMAEATHYLDSIYYLQKNYDLAYEYSHLNKAYSDSLAITERNSELLQLEIKNEESQILYSEEKEKAKVTFRHRAQLTGFVVGIVFLIIIVIVVLRNYKVEQNLNRLLGDEKKRSDDLLLNILPSEVAEELKNKGSAEAKYFEHVTVLFTDFKGFTNISERLTPQQLVNELDGCFREFDLIMKKYNIEKIKTVGDAYLAVAGLPIPDVHHAENIIKAAIEIKQFMLARKKQLGENTFEIRIGVHSGSVVAGIVGVSKFAYDIWGDAVNIAARMEQHSEAGKINISHSTYELVKDIFNCTYRGKILAKNKGELNMYYVD